MLSNRNLFLLGSLTYFVLGCMAWYFYKERTAFTDLSFHLFEIIRTGKLAIQNFRFGAFFTQAFPLLASKAGLPLAQVAILYSLSFIILPFLLFVIVLKGLKQEKMALLLLLFSTLMVTHTFYWTQSELPQGMAFTVLYFALFSKSLENETVPNYYFGWALPLLFLVVFVHPLLLFVMVFTYLFLALSHAHKRAFVLYNLMGFVLMYYIKTKVFKTDYDAQAMDGLKNVFKLLPRFLTLESTQRFGTYLLKDYYALLLVFLTVVGWYSLRKAWLKLALVVSFSIGFICIVNATYYNGAQQYYIENQYLVLSIFVLLPLIYDVLPELRLKQWSVSIVPIIILMGLVRIGYSHGIYTERLDWMRQFMTSTASEGPKKLVVASSKVPTSTLLMTWGSHYEFWLLSTIEQGITRSITIEEKSGEYDWTMNNSHAFVTRWGVFNYTELNKKYFILNDTVAVYQRY